MSLEHELSNEASKLASRPPVQGTNSVHKWLQELLYWAAQEPNRRLRHINRMGESDRQDLGLLLLELGDYLGFDSRRGLSKHLGLELLFYVDHTIYRHTNKTLLPRRMPVYTPQDLRLIWDISQALDLPLRWKRASCGMERDVIRVEEIEAFEKHQDPTKMRL